MSGALTAAQIGAPARRRRQNAVMAKPLVFLVPGFFGFTSVGAVSYFEDVEQALGRALGRRGVQARIVRCATQPTASIRRRAEALRRQVTARGACAPVSSTSWVTRPAAWTSACC